MTLPTGISESQIKRFKLAGDLWPLHELAKSTLGSASQEWRPSRPLGGWLATYGKIGPDGGIVPTVDREGHVLEAAKEIGRIDWVPYIKGGTWNDTHDHECIVGLPKTLEFHDGTTELSKGHGKVGFWTTGHLFDRTDPKSWEGLTDDKNKPRTPTEHEFQRSDYFWQLSHMLKGTPRPLGLSADGVMAMSQCRRRILWARVAAAAVCEMPQNPDATVEPMIYAVMGRSVVGDEVPPECGKCNCPEGMCESLSRLSKASVGRTDSSYSTITPQLQSGITENAGLESANRSDGDVDDLEEMVLRLLMSRFFLSRGNAKKWLHDYFRRKANNNPMET